MNYADTPLCDSATVKLLQRCTDEVSRRYYLALNDWLERNIKQWCPKAYAMAKARMFAESQAALVEGGFHWSSQTMGGDELVTFWQHEVPIAKMRVELWCTKPSLPRTGIGSGAIAAWADNLMGAMDAAAKGGV